MARTRIKICGITRVDDALAAAEFGADAIGIVRHPGSPRCVDDETAANIVDAIPAFVTAVLLFMDAPVAQVKQPADAFGVGTIQLHGAETPVDVTDLQPLRVVKCLRADGERIRFDLTQWRRVAPRNLAGILLESPGQVGGSGVSNDWELIRQLRDEHYLDPPGPPIVVAGGLTPENVAAIVRELRPWAVDVSSGVEESKGVKSREKMRDFIQAVRSCDF